MAQKIETSGIVLQRYPYAETSQIAHVLTEQSGRVVVLARGAFRSKNSYEGPLDLLVRGSFSISLVKGRELGLLTGRKVETVYPGLRRSLGRFAASAEVLRLFVDTVPVGGGEAQAYHLLDRALLALEVVAPDRVPLLLLSLKLRLLRLLGLSPQLLGCIRCGRPRDLVVYVVPEGGAVCRDCLRRRGEGLTLEQPTWVFLTSLDRERLRDVPPPSARALGQARRILDHHLAYHLEWPMPSTPGSERLTRALARRSALA